MGELLMALLGSLIAFWLRFYTLENVGNFSAHELRQYMGHLLLGSSSLIAVLAWHGIYRRNMLLQARKVSRIMIKSVLGWTAGFLLVRPFGAGDQSADLPSLHGVDRRCSTMVTLLGWRRLPGCAPAQAGASGGPAPAGERSLLGGAEESLGSGRPLSRTTPKALLRSSAG